MQSIASFRNLDYYKLFSWFTYNTTSSVVIINSLFRGTQRPFSVKYLLGEANIA